MNVLEKLQHDLAMAQGELARCYMAEARIRSVFKSQPFYSARRNPELMKGWRMAMRGLIDALDGEGSWTKYPELHEKPEQSMHPIHDKGCYGIPCVCTDCECRQSEQA